MNTSSKPSKPKQAIAPRKQLSEWDRLAVVAMDAHDYLRRQKVSRELIRWRKERKPYVRVAYVKGLYLIVVPPQVATLLARKGVGPISSYPKE